MQHNFRLRSRHKDTFGMLFEMCETGYAMSDAVVAFKALGENPDVRFAADLKGEAFSTRRRIVI